jgi:hypothetical protein
VPVDIVNASGISTVTVNQQDQNGEWVSIGIYRFNGGAQEGVLIRTDHTNGYVVVDAVKFVAQPRTTP